MKETFINARDYKTIAEDQGPDAALKALAGDVLSEGTFQQSSESGNVHISMKDIAGCIVSKDRKAVTAFPITGSGLTETQAKRAFLKALLEPEAGTDNGAEVRLLVGGTTRPPEQWTFVKVAP